MDVENQAYMEFISLSWHIASKSIWFCGLAVLNL